MSVTLKILQKYFCYDISNLIIEIAFGKDDDYAISNGYYEKFSKEKEVTYEMFRDICGSGYKDFIKFILKKKSRCWKLQKKYNECLNWGLFGACQGGYLDIVKYLIIKGARDLNDGVRGASYGGYIDIITFLIKKSRGPRRIKYRTKIDWNNALLSACFGDNIKTIEFIIKKGGYYWNWGLHGACEGNRLEACRLMIEKGADDWNGGLEIACFYGNTELVELMIEKGATECRHLKCEMNHQYNEIESSDSSDSSDVYV